MARVTVRVPRVLAQLTGGASSLDAAGTNLGEALHDLAERHPALSLHLFDDTGAVRHNVLCFLNDEGARGRAALDRALNDDDTITIVNSLAGGL